MAKSAKKKRQPGPTAAPAVGSAVAAKVKRLPGKVLGLAGRKVQRLKKGPPEDGGDRLAGLLEAVQAVGAGKKKSPRTQKLLSSGVPKMAQKLVEEAAETAIDAVRGVRTGVINESADLLYNLVVLWSAVGVTPGDIWAEMDRRAAMLGLAEKLPKPDANDL